MSYTCGKCGTPLHLYQLGTHCCPTVMPPRAADRPFAWLGCSAHQGPVCDYCSFSTDDDTVPCVVFWPCPTVQIIDDLPAPGLRLAAPAEENTND